MSVQAVPHEPSGEVDVLRLLLAATEPVDIESALGSVASARVLRSPVQEPEAVAALLWNGRSDDARRAAEHLLMNTCAERDDGPEAVAGAERAAELRWLLATVELVHGDHDAASTIVGRALADSPSDRWALRLRAVGAVAQLLSGDLAAAAEIAAGLEPANGLAAPDGTAHLYLLHVRAVLAYQQRDESTLEHLLDAAQALPEYDRDPGQRLINLLLRAAAGRTTDVMVTVERARPLAQQLGGLWLDWWYQVVALTLYNSGEWDAAVHLVGEGIAWRDTAPYAVGRRSIMERTLRAVAVMIAAHRGDAAEAAAQAGMMRASSSRGLARYYEGVVVLAEAFLAEAEGRADDAARHVRTIVDGLIGVDGGTALLGAASHVTRIALAAGDRDLALRVLTSLRANPGMADTAPALLVAGLVDGDIGPLAEARDRFVAQGDVLEAAWAETELARLLAESGRRDDARATYVPVEQRLRGLSAEAERGRAEAGLRGAGVRLGARGSRARARTGWHSLTESELRVAVRVAEGLTNPEIGRALFLSPRTVQSHVSSALAKLGISSRVELAGEVGRHSAAP